MHAISALTDSLCVIVPVAANRKMGHTLHTPTCSFAFVVCMHTLGDRSPLAPFYLFEHEVLQWLFSHSSVKLSKSLSRDLKAAISYRWLKSASQKKVQ